MTGGVSKQAASHSGSPTRCRSGGRPPDSFRWKKRLKVGREAGEVNTKRPAEWMREGPVTQEKSRLLQSKGEREAPTMATPGGGRKVVGPTASGAPHKPQARAGYIRASPAEPLGGRSPRVTWRHPSPGTEAAELSHGQAGVCSPLKTETTSVSAPCKHVLVSSGTVFRALLASGVFSD